MLGSMDRYRPKIGDDLAAELSAEQRQEVEDWIKGQAKEAEASINRVAITLLPENLGRAASAISPETSLELVNDIYVAMAGLAKSLRKAGFKRPQKPSKGSSKANPQEPTLL
jgi:hypothetical protein